VSQSKAHTEQMLDQLTTRVSQLERTVSICSQVLLSHSLRHVCLSRLQTSVTHQSTAMSQLQTGMTQLQRAASQLRSSSAQLQNEVDELKTVIARRG